MESFVDIKASNSFEQSSSHKVYILKESGSFPPQKGALVLLQFILDLYHLVRFILRLAR